jgi:hypothetical protein
VSRGSGDEPRILGFGENRFPEARPAYRIDFETPAGGAESMGNRLYIRAAVTAVMAIGVAGITLASPALADPRARSTSSSIGYTPTGFPAKMTP